MSIKRILSLFLFISLMILPASCGKSGDNTDTTASGNITTEPQPEETTTADTETTTATMEAGDITNPAGTDAPEPTFEPLSATPPKSLKILAIGNSFSTDCMQYLYQIAKDGGVEEIVLGNLYYAGCSLQQHLGFATNDAAEYTYYKNTAGMWSSTKNVKMSTAIADEDWDYITLQQTSKTCGLANTYGDTLTKLVDYVRLKNSTATLVWNATWAYQQDSTHSSFPNYGKDQMKMYDMIIDCVEQCILSESRFELVIPCMTAIQNARTSFIGDTLTRDGYHMDYNIGRYIVGLTWYAAITNAPIDGITYNPSTTNITDDMVKVAKEAVTAAIKTPYAVTKSAITTGELPKQAETIDPSVVLDPADFREADTAVAVANGVDLSGYTLLEWSYLENTYWNCTGKAGTATPKSTASTYQQNICTEKKYSLTELPLGTVFVLDSGWQYRLEIYAEENAKYTGTRPSMNTAQFYTLTQEFMGDCKYIAWNISSNSKTDISAIYAQAACHLRVYIPNTPAAQ